MSTWDRVLFLCPSQDLVARAMVEMTQCPLESSGLDQGPSPAAVSLGGHRVGQPGFRGLVGQGLG